MAVSLISSETVKPSFLPIDIHLIKPYKLCLFDQITPSTYVSVIVFYRAGEAETGLKVPETLARLKKSLSETLALFYPLSGRTKNNLYIDDFEAGVTYMEARVNCTLDEYFKLRRTEPLNQLAPFLAFCNETDTSKPQFGFQINLFSCGGMAIGTSLGHKIADGGTLSHLLTSWAAAFRGEPQKIVKPNLINASVVFPPRDDLPQHFPTLMRKTWFYKRGSFATRIFKFDADTIADLRCAASSERALKPSRNEVLTSFIWKRANAASQAAKGDRNPRASVIGQAANLRTRMKSRDLNATVGNVFWWARAMSNDSAGETLPELTRIVRESFVNFNKDFSESGEAGHVGFAAASDLIDALRGIFSSEENAPELYFFSNWNVFFNEVNFGWGKPVWVSAHGQVGPEFVNQILFVDAQDGSKGMEAFVTLEETHMAFLEKDPDFLAFANPKLY